jgi:hypothetical protein
MIARKHSRAVQVGLWIACWHLRAVRVKLQVPPLRSPGFPVQLSGVGELRAAFLTESRIRRLGGTAT